MDSNRLTNLHRGDLSRRDLLRLGAGAAALFGLQACAAPTASPQAGIQPDKPVLPTVLRLALPQNIPSIDGRTGGGGVSQQNVFMHIYDPLVDLSPKVAPRARLAESWELVNPTTWRFKLRQGVKFQNGEEFNAEAVKFTIEQFANLTPPYQYLNNWGAAWPPAIEIESPFSVLLKTPRPQPAVPQLLSRMSMLPPKAALEPGFARLPIGTGPYRVSQWEQGQKIVLEANPSYWQGEPKIKQLVWQTILDQSARMAALQSGDIDLIWDVPYERIGELTSSAKFKVQEEASLGLAFIAFNFRAVNSPIADVRVRRALTYAIDHQGIRDSLLSGKGELNRGPAPSLALGSVDAGGYPRRDLATARRLLSEAGASNLKLTFIFAPGQFAKDLEIAEAIIGQLSDAGVAVNFEQFDSAQMTQRRPMANWDIMPNGVPGSFTGEAPYHYAQLKSQQGFTSAAVEQFLDQADAVGPVPQRTGFIQQGMKAMWDDVPYLWSVGRTSAFGMVKSLQAIEYIPINWLLFHGARFE